MGFATSRLCLAFLLSLSWAAPSFAQVTVLTEHNDVARDGANTQETYLTTANVNVNTFGQLFTDAVDGFIVGQPLYVSGVQFPNGSTHNVIYVATQHDSVFAFDADSMQAPLWTVSFINPSAGITTVPISDYGCAGTAFTEIGVVSTPVIDATAGTIFVLVKTLENGAYIYRLHSLSLTTGADVIPPTVISASASTNGGTVQFNSAIQMQRPALLLQNGTLYIGFGSNGCDTYAFQGWLLAYSETTLQQTGAFLTTPNGTKGGVWQSGGGPAVDENGNIFLAVGNGTFDANTGGSDYGDSLVQFSPSTGFAVTDYFTPYNQAVMNKQDLDLGAGGVVVLPDQAAPHIHEVVAIAKTGTLYLVDRDNMGGNNTGSDSQIVQSIPGAAAGRFLGVPGYWNGNVYVSGQTDYIKVFSLSNDLLSTQPTSQTSIKATTSGSVSISANGTNDGILWDIPNLTTLYAFDATNLATILYSSAQATGSRDKLGTVAKFVSPTVANGKVYVGSKTALVVYGLFPLISPAAGGNQSAYVGTTLPVALQVQTVDGYQQAPIGNIPVTCKDGGVGGTFGTTMPMVTNSQGQASTTYQLPKKALTITITCTSSKYISGSFTEVATAGPVTRETVVSGNAQTQSVSTPLPANLVVQVLDPYAYAVPGATVTFSDGGAGGSFSPSTAVSNSAGQAITSYTTPANPGTVTISATTAGVTAVKFTETVVAAGPNFGLSITPASLKVAQGNSSSPATITVNPTDGFSGTVTLAASGLANGVTATFNPTTTTSTSTLTFAASSTAKIGAASVTVTGTSGSVTQTAKIGVTVTAP
jgi:hypothetical protein